MGVVFSLMDTLDTLCKENHVKSLKSVTVALGEASLVVPSYLEECWRAATEAGPRYQKTKLVLHLIKAMGRCDKCSKIYPIVEFSRKCPDCGNDSFTLVDGTQIEITQLVADD